VQGTGTFDFLGNEGQTILSSFSKSDEEGNVHFGQQFGPGDFEGGLPSSITFYGVRYRGILEAYVDIPPSIDSSQRNHFSNAAVSTRNYNLPAFFLTASNNVGAVPEPASWALMLGGFGLTGMAMRRRAKVRVTYA
jgi:hypothetical protein